MSRVASYSVYSEQSQDETSHARGMVFLPGQVTVSASVRYCNQGHYGFEFVGLHDQQREAIQAACDGLRNTSRQR